MILPINVLSEAADLVTDPDPSSTGNPEYDRAILELTSRLLGYTEEQRTALLQTLHALKYAGNV